MAKKPTPPKKARNFYLIVRGKKSVHHKAPFHKVIICTRKHTADWESKRTKDGHTVYVCLAPDSLPCNWTIVKYKGYDLDTRFVLHYLTLFDGNNTKDLTTSDKLDKLFKKAIWWSYDEMPEYFKNKGVKYPSDSFTKKIIWEDAGTVLIGYSKEQKYKQSRISDIPLFLK